MSTDTGLEEKTWIGEQAPTIATAALPVQIQQSHYRNTLDVEGILTEGAKGAWLLRHRLRKRAAWECQGRVCITFPQHLLCALPVIRREKESTGAKGWVQNAWERYENLGRMRRNLGDNCAPSMGSGSILSCTGTSHKQDYFMQTLLTLQAPSVSSSP